MCWTRPMPGLRMARSPQTVTARLTDCVWTADRDDALPLCITQHGRLDVASVRPAALCLLAHVGGCLAVGTAEALVEVGQIAESAVGCDRADRQRRRVQVAEPAMRERLAGPPEGTRKTLCRPVRTASGRNAGSPPGRARHSSPQRTGPRAAPARASSWHRDGQRAGRGCWPAPRHPGWRRGRARSGHGCAGPWRAAGRYRRTRDRHAVSPDSPSAGAARRFLWGRGA